MQNTFIQTRGDQVIVDRSDLTLYAVIALLVIAVVIVIAIAIKRRKQNFIKTMPTNLKDEE